MKVLFVTNVPSPYRIDFFNEISKYCDLTVCFERLCASDRDEKWKNDSGLNFKYVNVSGKPFKEDKTIGTELTNYIKRAQFDVLVFTNYSSPSVMRAISWCRRHKKKYYMEYDGGFCKKDSLVLKLLKKYLLGGASGHFTTCEEHIKYLKSIGIKECLIWKYPFTSVTEEDLSKAQSILSEGKELIRKRLGITEEKVVLSVGRFIHCKGFDILLNAAKKIDKTVGFYIVGGNPTEEYLKQKSELELDNVHFVGFKTKDELVEYYAAADLFAMTTRGDVWGLVINEAMAYGLPVISSDACIAALEMVHKGKNGYIVPSEDVDAFADAMKKLLLDDDMKTSFSEKSREVVKEYTIEKMAQRHIEIFEEITGATR